MVKIAGAVNPADLFTKHSLSRERLMKLTQLFNFNYLSGRAESAPKTRTAPRQRITMAEADGTAALGAVDVEGEMDPEMPHLEWDDHELSLRYPPLTIHDDVHDEAALADDDDDGIVAEGERIVKEIMDEARRHARRRHVRQEPERTLTEREGRAHG